MQEKTYTTKQVAAAAGIHVNTVRFYESIGFLTPPRRRPNGYRVYTELQLRQCRLIRCAMRAEVLQNGLRQKAVEIVRLCAGLDFDAAEAAAGDYLSMLREELRRAGEAAASVEHALGADDGPPRPSLSRRQAAEALGVTAETLRTWERNGLLAVGRRENGYRLYTPADMRRLGIIRTLRCANYSLAAILRLLGGPDEPAAGSVARILNHGGEGELLSACDALIVSLRRTAADAEELARMLAEMKEMF